MYTIECDRCGKEITDRTAYVISTKAFVLAGGFRRITTDGKIENILNAEQPKKHLCKECKDEIKEFINNPTVKEVDENVD